MALEQPADVEPYCTVCGISEKDVTSSVCADCAAVIWESLRDAPPSSCNLKDQHDPSAAYEVHRDHAGTGIEWAMHGCDLTAGTHSLRTNIAQRCTVCGGDDRVDMVSNICAPCTFILSESKNLAPVHPEPCTSENQNGEGQDDANLGQSLAACNLSESNVSPQEGNHPEYANPGQVKPLINPNANAEPTKEGNQPEYAKPGQVNPLIHSNTNAEPIKKGSQLEYAKPGQVNPLIHPNTNAEPIKEGFQPEDAKLDQVNPLIHPNTTAEPIKGGLTDLSGDCLGHIASCLDKVKDRRAFSHTCRSTWNAEHVLHHLGSLKVTLTLADVGAILRLAPFWEKQRRQLELMPMKREFKRVLILKSCGDLQRIAGLPWFRDPAAPSLEGAVLDSWSKITDDLPQDTRCALASFDEVVLEYVHLEKMEEAQALGIDMLRKCPNIVSLTVDNCHLHTSFLDSMSPTLASISISGFSPRPRRTQWFLQAVGALPKLKHLSLAPESHSSPKPPLDLSVLVGRCPQLETLTLRNTSEQEGDAGSVPLQCLEQLLQSCPSLLRLTLGQALMREASVRLHSTTLQYIEVEQSDLMGMPCCDYSCFAALQEARVGYLCFSQDVMDGIGVFADRARAISRWQPGVCIDAVRLQSGGHQSRAAYTREMLQVLSILHRQAGHSVYSLSLSGFLHPDTLSKVSLLLPNVEEVHVFCFNDDDDASARDADGGEVCPKGFFQTLLGFSKLRRLIIGGSPGDDLVLWVCQQAQESQGRFWSLKVIVGDSLIKVKCKMLWQGMLSGQQQRVFIE